MATPCTSCSKQSLVTSMIPSIFPPITIWWSLSIHCLWNFHWVHVLPYSLSFHSLGHSYFSSTLQPYPLSQCLSLSRLCPFLLVWKFYSLCHFEKNNFDHGTLLFQTFQWILLLLEEHQPFSWPFLSVQLHFIALAYHHLYSYTHSKNKLFF